MWKEWAVSCWREVPFISRHAIFSQAAEDLKVVLADASQTVDAPDYWGEEWYEVYQGNPVLPTYVMVDILGRGAIASGRVVLPITWERIFS